MNSNTARVDFLLIDGEVSVFLIIVGSFLLGFFTCLIFLWLKKTLGDNKKSKSTMETKKEIELFREI